MTHNACILLKSLGGTNVQLFTKLSTDNISGGKYVYIYICYVLMKSDKKCIRKIPLLNSIE